MGSGGDWRQESYYRVSATDDESSDKGDLVTDSLRKSKGGGAKFTLQVNNFQDQMNEAALNRTEHKRKSRLGDLRFMSSVLNALHLRCLRYTAIERSGA